MWCDIVSKNTKSSVLKPFYFAFLYLFCFVSYAKGNCMSYGAVSFFTYLTTVFNENPGY